MHNYIGQKVSKNGWHVSQDLSIGESPREPLTVSRGLDCHQIRLVYGALGVGTGRRMRTSGSSPAGRFGPPRLPPRRRQGAVSRRLMVEYLRLLSDLEFHRLRQTEGQREVLAS